MVTKPSGPLYGGTLISAVTTLSKIRVFITKFSAWLAGAAVFAVMGLVVSDVTGRWLFRRPIPSTFEIVQNMLPVIAFLAVAQAESLGRHIRVMVLGPRLSASKQVYLDVAVRSICVVVCSIITWQTLGYGFASWSIRETSMGLIPIPIYPTKLAIGVGFLLLSLQFAVDLADTLVNKLARRGAH